MSPRSAPVVVFLIGLLIRVGLILAYPALYGGDTMLRLMNLDRILLAYQLPLLQTILFSAGHVTRDVIAIDCLMAVIGAVAGVGFYYVATDLVDRDTAFAGALLFTSNPFVVGISVVPYQESLMLAGLFFAFHFFATRRYLLSSACLALACLTRFEAWIAAPVLAGAYIVRQRSTGPESDESSVRTTVLSSVRAVLLFGWAPAIWLVAHAGLSPEGTFVVESSVSWVRLWRWYHLGGVAARYTPLIVTALAVGGVWAAWSRRRDARLWCAAAFVGAFLVAILFSAHGDGPDHERFVTSREAHVVIASVALLATLALQRITRFRLVVAALGLALGVYGAREFLATETSRPNNALSYQLARYLDTHVADGERALILARPIPYPRGYLETARRAGGQRGVEAAVRQFSRSGTEPLDYQRTVVQSGLPRARLLSPATARIRLPGDSTPVTDSLPCTDWVAVWSDYEATTPSARLMYERAFARTEADTVLRAGPLAVAVARVQCR